MITLIALPTLVIYVVVLGVAMAILRSESRAEVEQEVARLADNYAARFDGAFREAAAIGRRPRTGSIEQRRCERLTRASMKTGIQRTPSAGSGRMGGCDKGGAL